MDRGEKKRAEELEVSGCTDFERWLPLMCSIAQCDVKR
jgi:hypothetical protein